mmetsp:Transcript_3042/g.6673  ORF Transcript_3042/g.6673 Transcript_3042/m.6673 type:complete len:106 (+) Transcript_3042:62-379(+)
MASSYTGSATTGSWVSGEGSRSNSTATGRSRMEEECSNEDEDTWMSIDEGSKNMSPELDSDEFEGGERSISKCKCKSVLLLLGLLFITHAIALALGAAIGMYVNK